MKITEEHFNKFADTFDDDTQISVSWKDTFCQITTLQFHEENEYKVAHVICGIGYFNKEENFEKIKEHILKNLEEAELQLLSFLK